MANILVLAPQWPYPPQQGTTLRNFNLIAGLARRGHVIDLATFAVEGSDDPPGGETDGLLGDASPLHAYCRHLITAPQPVRSLARRARDTVFQRWPDMALRLDSPAMHARLDELLARVAYDVVQVEGIEMAPYAMGLPASTRAWLVFDDHNAEYVLQRRAFSNDVRHPRRWLAAAYSLAQWQKLSRYERRICRAANCVIAVSEVDAQAIRRLQPGLDVTVIPNGVDLAYYDTAQVSPVPDLRQPALIFTGKMDYRPNIDAALWFAEAVLPLIVRQLPGAHFYVVGQRPHPRLDVLRGHPAVTLTGHVPDVRPYMAGAAVYVVPLRIGGGTRLKVLEAMAMGLAVVSTHLGCDGFSFEDGREVLFADEPAVFAQRVVDLWHNRSLAATIGQAARSYVAAHYAWETIVPQLEKIYPARLHEASTRD